MMELDHFIYGVKNLESGIDFFQKKSGVLPAHSGQHLALGTHNALASLGKTYFEILAMDPS